MTDFYIPKNCMITVFGQTHRFVRGIHPVPDLIANSHEANGAGIKPVEEMTDGEYVLLGMETPSAKDAREKAEAVASEGQTDQPKVVEFNASKVAETAPAKPDKAK